MSAKKQQKITFFTKQPAQRHDSNTNPSTDTQNTFSNDSEPGTSTGTVNSNDKDDSTVSSTQLKRKTVRKFTNVTAWAYDFEWFEFDKEKELMHCKICISSKNKLKISLYY